MGIHLMGAKVKVEPIWRLYSLCMYISMETVVGTSIGLSVFCNFNYVIQTSENVKSMINNVL